MQHRLTLLKVGIPIDKTSMFIPPGTFRQEAVEIISKAREAGWLSVGINTALLSETGSQFGTPSVRIDQKYTPATIQQKLDSLKSLGQGNYFVVYNNRWGDIGKIIGGNIFYLSDMYSCGPYTPDIDDISDTWRLELQKGTWPRDIGRNPHDFVSMQKPSLTYNIETIYPENYDWNDTFMRAARDAALRFIRNSAMRESIGELMSVTGKKEVALNWEFYRGVLTPLDFN